MPASQTSRRIRSVLVACGALPICLPASELAISTTPYDRPDSGGRDTDHGHAATSVRTFFLFFGNFSTNASRLRSDLWKSRSRRTAVSTSPTSPSQTWGHFVACVKDAQSYISCSLPPRSTGTNHNTSTTSRAWHQGPLGGWMHCLAAPPPLCVALACRRIALLSSPSPPRAKQGG